MLNSRGVKISKMERVGFGGEILILEKAGKKYVMKAANQAQSINEYVAQHLLKALGYADVPVELFKYEGKFYGVTEFQEGITQLSPLELSDRSDAIRQTVLELFILNQVLDNADAGEFYFQGDKVISLDYGEALIPPSEVYKILWRAASSVEYRNDVGSSARNAFEVLSNHYEADLCSKALENLTERFANLNISDMADCFVELDKRIFNYFATIYEDYILRIKREMANLKI